MIEKGLAVWGEIGLAEILVEDVGMLNNLSMCALCQIIMTLCNMVSRYLHLVS